MAEPSVGIQTAQVVGWVVTGAAFVGNLIWNWRNRVHTNTLAATIRLEQHSRENWSRLRARIEEKLEKLVDEVCRLPAELKALADGSDAVKFLEVINLQLVAAQDRLARALQEADASAYSQFSDWNVAGTGAQHGQESSWDLLLSKFDEAIQAPDLASQITLLSEMKAFVLEIEAAVWTKVRGQEWHFEPAT